MYCIKARTSCEHKQTYPVMLILKLIEMKCMAHMLPYHSCNTGNREIGREIEMVIGREIEMAKTRQKKWAGMYSNLKIRPRCAGDNFN